MDRFTDFGMAYDDMHEYDQLTADEKMIIECDVLWHRGFLRFIKEGYDALRLYMDMKGVKPDTIDEKRFAPPETIIRELFDLVSELYTDLEQAIDVFEGVSYEEVKKDELIEP